MSEPRFIERLLRITAFDYCETIWWRKKEGQRDVLQFFVNCNDVFAWACADAEEVTAENIGELERAFKEVEALLGSGNAENAGDLFVARVRQMRPQGAMYEYYDPKLWPLFDAAGPKRETGFGNPVDRDGLVPPSPAPSEAPQ